VDKYNIDVGVGGRIYAGYFEALDIVGASLCGLFHTSVRPELRSGLKLVNRDSSLTAGKLTMLSKFSFLHRELPRVKSQQGSLRLLIVPQHTYICFPYRHAQHRDDEVLSRR
jgi:hypothetical protein